MTEVYKLGGDILNNTLINSELNFKGKSIPIHERNFSSPKKYHTTRYIETLKIIEKENIAQLEISKALDFYFYQDRLVPLSEKFSIEEINYCPQSRIILFRMRRNTDYTYENRTEFARETGWYFYVTGTAIPQSEISKYVDSCSHSYNKEQFKWDFNPNVNLTISSITSSQNENSYLLQLGNRNILLDGGLEKNPNLRKDSIQLIKSKGGLDAIFISHADDDHIRGLSDLIKEFPNVPIIISATSLDFFLLKQRRYNNTIDEKQIINNSLIVKNKEKIHFNRNGYMQFFFAGHMPGALILFLEFEEYRFLFTGDYSYHSYRPIPGIDIIINDIPSPIDFLLVDGTSSYTHYDTPPYQFNFLKDNITFNAQNKDDVLIGADPESTAIIIFLTLHFHFLSLKEDGFELRPNFFLSDNIRESVKILCSRLDDIHPVTADNIENEFNPFSGALIQWIRNKMYLFRWDVIPGNDDKRLIEFMKNEFGLDWVVNARIEKIDNGMTIRLSFENNSVYLRLNDEKTKVNLKINDVRTYELIAWTENSKINRYNPTNKFDIEKKLKERNRKNGNVVIFDSPDLSNKWMVDLFKIIASYKFNSIYLSGALRSLTANELVSGNDDVEFEFHDKIEKFSNKAIILNRIGPVDILNLHGDDYQLGEIIKTLKPKQICFFQQDPKKLKGVRNWIIKEYPFVKKTHAFYPKENNKILDLGSVKS